MAGCFDNARASDRTNLVLQAASGSLSGTEKYAARLDSVISFR